MVNAIANLFGGFLTNEVNQMHQERLMKMQNQQNKDIFHLQNQANINNALHAGRIERASKEGAGLNINSDAGFNPISAMSAPSTSAPQAPQMSPVDFVQADLAESQADLNRAQADAIRKRTPAEIEKLGSETALNRVNARLSGVHADNLPAKYIAEINEIIQRMVLEQAQTDTEFDKQENIQSDTDVNKAKVGVLESEEALNEEKKITEKVQQNKLRAEINDLYAHVQWLKSDKSLKDEEKEKVIEETGKAMYEKLLGRKNVIYYEEWLNNTIKRSHYQNLKDYNDARLTMQQAIMAYKQNDWFAWHEAMDVLKLGASQQSQLLKILAK